MFGDHTKNVKYIDFPFVIGADGTQFHKIIEADAEYVFYWMQYIASTIKDKGYARHYSLVKKSFLPLPPLFEQKRIVRQIKELIPLVSIYNYKNCEIEEQNTRFPEQLKKSILLMAVQGKLVPQDENDEPASVLLERIRAEKQRLIVEGKIKKDKSESVIFRRDNSHYEKLNGTENCIDDEIPFDIPDSWCWARLGIISTYAYTKKKINAQNADKDIWGLDLEDIEKGGKLVSIKTVGERKAVGDKTCFYKGDVLYSKLRPYLLKIMVAPMDGICTPEIVPFKVFGSIDTEYIVNYLKSPYVDNIINSIT
jgi:type I restriction enzyme S subunit